MDLGEIIFFNGGDKDFTSTTFFQFANHHLPKNPAPPVTQNRLLSKKSLLVAVIFRILQNDKKFQTLNMENRILSAFVKLHACSYRLIAYLSHIPFSFDVNTGKNASCTFLMASSERWRIKRYISKEV
jgi:hypothetical protein